MFNEMRRNDRKISNDEAVKLLESAYYGVLSTIGENGYAYGVPLSYIYMEDSIYFHCAMEGSKLDNIVFNNKVSFCVVGEIQNLPDKFSTAYESVILFGKAGKIDGDEKEKALMGLIQKYSSEHMAAGKEYIKHDFNKTMVMKIDIEHMEGKARRK